MPRDTRGSSEFENLLASMKGKVKQSDLSRLAGMVETGDLSKQLNNVKKLADLYSKMNTAWQKNVALGKTKSKQAANEIKANEKQIKLLARKQQAMVRERREYTASGKVINRLADAYERGKQEAEDFAGVLPKNKSLLTGVALAAAYAGTKINEFGDEILSFQKKWATYNLEMKVSEKLIPGMSTSFNDMRKSLNMTSDEMSSFVDTFQEGVATTLLSARELEKAAKQIENAFGTNPTDMLKSYVDITKEIPRIKQIMSKGGAELSDLRFSLASSGRMGEFLKLQQAGLLGGKGIGGIDTEKEALQTQRSMESIMETMESHLSTLIPTQTAIVTKLTGIAVTLGGMAVTTAIQLSTIQSLLAFNSVTGSIGGKITAGVGGAVSGGLKGALGTGGGVVGGTAGVGTLVAGGLAAAAVGTWIGKSIAQSDIGRSIFGNSAGDTWDQADEWITEYFGGKVKWKEDLKRKQQQKAEEKSMSYQSLIQTANQIESGAILELVKFKKETASAAVEQLGLTGEGDVGKAFERLGKTIEEERIRRETDIKYLRESTEEKFKAGMIDNEERKNVLEKANKLEIDAANEFAREMSDMISKYFTNNPVFIRMKAEAERAESVLNLVNLGTGRSSSGVFGRTLGTKFNTMRSMTSGEGLRGFLDLDAWKNASDPANRAAIEEAFGTMAGSVESFMNTLNETASASENDALVKKYRLLSEQYKEIGNYQAQITGDVTDIARSVGQEIKMQNTRMDFLKKQKKRIESGDLSPQQIAADLYNRAENEKNKEKKKYLLDLAKGMEGLSSKEALTKIETAMAQSSAAIFESFMSAGDAVEAAMNNISLKTKDAVAEMIETELSLAAMRMNTADATRLANHGEKIIEKRRIEALKTADEAYNVQLENLRKQVESGRIQKDTQAYVTAMKKIEYDREKKLGEIRKTAFEAQRQNYKALEEVAMKGVDFAKEELDIQKDMADTMGASMGTIFSLQMAGIDLARRERDIKLETYERALEVEGDIEGKERARLDYVKAQTDLQKAAMGVQRDAFDRLLDKAFGAISQQRGARRQIMTQAQMFGRGFVQNQNTNLVVGGMAMQLPMRQAMMAAGGAGNPPMMNPKNLLGGNAPMRHPTATLPTQKVDLNLNIKGDLNEKGQATIKNLLVRFMGSPEVKAAMERNGVVMTEK